MIALEQIGLERFQARADDAARLMKALSNRNRLMILCRLTGGERQVGDLAAEVGLSQSALSQHLARLRRDGLVNTRRNAQTIFYSMNDRATQAILRTLYDIYSPAELTESIKQKLFCDPKKPDEKT